MDQRQVRVERTAGSAVYYPEAAFWRPAPRGVWTEAYLGPWIIFWAAMAAGLSQFAVFHRQVVEGRA